MNNKLKQLSAACVMGLALFASCKKSDSSSSPASEITGKWKKTSGAVDANGNGSIDAGETTADTTNTYFTFNGDGSVSGTSSATGTPITLPGTWALVGGNTYLRIIDVVPIIGITDTISYHVDNLSSTSMTLRDTSDHSRAGWAILTKQ